MTGREEFQKRRDHGLRERHARRLLNAATPPCTACGASYAGCESREWLSGRRCCESCTHTEEVS